MKLKTKVWVISVLTFVAVITIMLVGLFTLRYTSSQDNKARVYQLLTSTYSTITEIENYAAQGKMSEQEAKALATQILRENKYHKSEYVYVADENMNFIAAPLDPQLHNTSFHDFKDGDGKSVGNIILTAVQNQPSGIVEYAWTKKKSDGSIEEVLSIVQISERWRWVVGTGIGFHEVNARFWSTAQWQLILCLLISAVLSLCVFYTVRKLLLDLGTEPTELLRLTREVASGNFDHQTDGEFDRNSVYGSVLRMQRALKEVLNSLSNATIKLHDEVHSAEERSTKIEKTFQSQSEEIDMVATSMTEMSSSANTVSDSAQGAAEATIQADEDGQKVQTIMSESAAATEALATQIDSAAQVIGDLGQDVGSIVSVLDVIRGIAEQTNLLALNAAIEAARAGDQGRGFAVVADEVRNLAKRTQDSTAEIQQMIERLQSGSQNAINSMETAKKSSFQTVTGAREASDALQQIAQALTTITEMNHQIATAAQEQTKVSDDISERINLIATGSQNAAALAQDNRRATDLISELATDLENQIGKLKFN
ncbi:methyl-accepting chemotaxis protein [Aliikangiella coralliicola]|uniref:Methyl-accepting chemotaxis protein n=1 Tax=Aliikangiella coralliicola TaxID=2592383 RepID=A0A545UB76_9GAMM|nr:methyl-accepting chemotaxis protein [Aliikangiella coralliicola]TQV86707.1 methyl-accepting chemotaxis protein [Aliikangiella coralliicola]